MISKLKLHLARALPSSRDIIFGSLLWMIAQTISATVNLLILRGDITKAGFELLILVSTCAALSYLPARLFANFVGGQSRRGRFSANFVMLTVFTFAIAALFYAVGYLQYYAQWHAPLGTKLWVIQTIFTLGAAVYQFAVLGFRLYLPIGAVALIAFSLFFARTGPQKHD